MLIGAAYALRCAVENYLRGTCREKLGWLTGLEPATTGLTIRDSTN